MGELTDTVRGPFFFFKILMLCAFPMHLETSCFCRFCTRGGFAPRSSWWKSCNDARSRSSVPRGSGDLHGNVYGHLTRLFLMKYMQTLGRLKSLLLGLPRCFKQGGLSTRCKYLSGAIFTLPIRVSQSIFKNALQCFIISLDSMSNFYVIVFTFLSTSSGKCPSLFIPLSTVNILVWVGYC